MEADSTFFIIVIALNILILASVIFFIIRARKKRKNMLGRFAKNKKGGGKVDGITYNYRYHPGAKNSPPFFKIEIDFSLDRKIKITKKTKFDKFAEKIELVDEIKTGDYEFDNRFFISSDYPGLCRKIFDKDDKRNAVKSIFNKGFTNLAFNGKRLYAMIKPYRNKVKITDSLIEEIVKKLKLLSADLQGLTMENFQPNKNLFNRVVAIASSSILSVMGILFLIFGFSRYQPLDEFTIFLDSLKYSLPIILIFNYFVFKILKGSTSAHKEMLVLGIISFIIFIFGGWGTLIFFNGKLDNSLPSEHQVFIQNKTYSSSRNSKNYYIFVQSWRGRGNEKIKISRKTYNQISDNEKYMLIKTKKGNFGYEWVVSKNLMNN